MLTGVSVLAGVGPVYFLVNADLMAAGYASALLMSALAGFLVSMAGEPGGVYARVEAGREAGREAECWQRVLLSC